MQFIALFRRGILHAMRRKTSHGKNVPTIYAISDVFISIRRGHFSPGNPTTFGGHPR
jgi:hypothetical protein